MSSILLALGLFLVSTSAIHNHPSGVLSKREIIDDDVVGVTFKRDAPSLLSVLRGIHATWEVSKKAVEIHKLMDEVRKADADVTALLNGQAVDHGEVSKMIDECRKENYTKATVVMEGSFTFSFTDNNLATALARLKCLTSLAERTSVDSKEAKVALASIREVITKIETILDTITAIASGVDGVGNDRTRRKLKIKIKDHKVKIKYKGPGFKYKYKYKF